MDPDPEAILAVSVPLLFEYFKFVFQCVPTIWWKSTLIVFLDQLRNVYYLCCIFMRVYLVDVILNVKDEATDSELIVPGNRAMSAILLAMACTIPHVVILLIDRCIVGSLDMGFAIRKHHRVNVFRRYLNYTEAARSTMGIHDLIGTQADVIPDLVEGGYLDIFEMVKEVGRIV